MKLRNLFVFLALFTGVSAVVLPPTPAHAVDYHECMNFLQPEGVAQYKYLGSFRIPKVEVPTAEGAVSSQKFVSDLVKKYSGAELGPKQGLNEAVDSVYRAIRDDASLNQMAKVEKMGTFGEELNPLFENFIKKYPATGDRTNANLTQWLRRRKAIDHVKRTKFALAMAVADLENFKLSEYQTVTKEEFILTKGNNQQKLTHLPLDEYPKYVESRVSDVMGLDAEKAKLYREIDEGSLGILSIQDIRDITSYNVWPMYLKYHDMRHVHYGTSHPLALAVMMRATRSKSGLRYNMLGGLYEGVDRIQYSREVSINRFFGTQVGEGSVVPGITRNMDLEEAMLTLGYSPDKTLRKICETIPDGSSYISYGNQLEGWTPKIVTGTTIRGKSLTNAGRDVRNELVDLEDDVREMVNRLTKLNKNGEKLEIQLLKNPAKELSEEQKMLMYMTHYQIDINSPEISIEGLRFKNDGRAHYSSYQDANGPIGIGDQ